MMPYPLIVCEVKSYFCDEGMTLKGSLKIPLGSCYTERRSCNDKKCFTPRVREKCFKIVIL